MEHLVMALANELWTLQFTGTEIFF